MVEDFYGDGEVIAVGTNHTNPNASPADPWPSQAITYRIPADPTQPWEKTVLTDTFQSVPGSSTSPQAAPLEHMWMEMEIGISRFR